MSAVMVPYVHARQLVRPASRVGSALAARGRSVVVATLDGALGRALARELEGLRWSVQAAGGAAAVFALLEQEPVEAVLLDSWLPDLEMVECVRELARQFPELDVLTTDGSDIGAAPARGRYRGEVLHALRQAQNSLQQDLGKQGTDAPAWQDALPAREILRRHLQPDAAGGGWGASPGAPGGRREVAARPGAGVGGVQGVVAGAGALSIPGGMFQAASALTSGGMASSVSGSNRDSLADSVAAWMAGPIAKAAAARPAPMLPEFVGGDARLKEMSRRIGLVAHRRTAVLVHGPTGTGKELVARAIHRLSGRERFIAINCAAIPEALIEAELFGHARGAFTGAVQSRTGRIEAAAGGTLFLDEIGELPLPVQSKLLRFLECGELQRVGENEVIRVDARVVAATHRKLGAMAAEGTFRLDLLHRLSVFLIETPPLAGRRDDIDALLKHTLARLAAEEAPEPAKQLNAAARAKLHAHAWPGNVRELEHTVERAWILAGESTVIEPECVEFGEALL